MIGKVNVKVGEATYGFEIEEPKEIDTLHKTIVLGNPPRQCTSCQSANVQLDSNKDRDGNTYINVLCNDCGAKAKLGQYKSGGYFWKEFEKYVRSEQSQPAQTVESVKEAPTNAPKEEEIDLSDLPF